MNNLKINERFEDFLRSIPVVKANGSSDGSKQFETKLITCNAINCNIEGLNENMETITISDSGSILAIKITDEYYGEGYLPLCLMAMSDDYLGYFEIQTSGTIRDIIPAKSVITNSDNYSFLYFHPMVILQEKDEMTITISYHFGDS